MNTFRVPCNWDPQLLSELATLPEAVGLYGMLPAHVAGGGRPSAAFAPVTPEAAQEFIRATRAQGLDFHYLFNAPCLDAREYTAAWQREFLAHLEWAIEAGSSGVIVTVPLLLELIKRRYPQLKVAVSSFARVNSPRRAQYFEDLGADEITLDPISITHDLPRLTAIRRRVSCALSLIANGCCLEQCPYAGYHSVLMGHSSQSGHPSGGQYQEYPFFSCTLRKLTDPVELVRTAFIRPEDLESYARLGLTHFKLVDRTRPTAWLIRALGAYQACRYDGNLLDILNFPEGYLTILYKQAGLPGEPVFPTLENRELDGLLAARAELDCALRSCADCPVCAEYARRAVTLPPGVERLTGVLRDCREQSIGAPLVESVPPA